jgi:hypothetical protein
MKSIEKRHTRLKTKEKYTEVDIKKLKSLQVNLRKITGKNSYKKKDDTSIPPKFGS